MVAKVSPCPPPLNVKLILNFVDIYSSTSGFQAFLSFTGIVALVLSRVMEFRQHLDTALKEIIRDLQQGGHRGCHSETTGLRLEVLYETALINEDISLEAIDLINEARKHLNVTSYQQQPFRGYEAPEASEEGRRGRPKFAISEQQLLFFRGKEDKIVFKTLK